MRTGECQRSGVRYGSVTPTNAACMPERTPSLSSSVLGEPFDSPPDESGSLGLGRPKPILLATSRSPALLDTHTPVVSVGVYHVPFAAQAVNPCVKRFQYAALMNPSSVE